MSSTLAVSNLPMRTTLVTVLLVALPVALLWACAVPGARQRPINLHPQYIPTLQAVQEALEREDLALAERTLLHWRARLGVDAAAAAQATPEAPLELGRPSAAAVADAEQLAENLGLVIEARRTVAALDLGLELRRIAGAQRVEIWLTAESSLAEPVSLVPGPGNLEVERLSLDPKTGLEVRATELLALTRAVRLEIPAGGAADALLGDVAIGVPGGAIATRSRFNLVMRSGSVTLQGRVLPVRAMAVRGAERTDLPSWLPTAPVEPAELARLVAQPGAPLTALVERAVRILPERRVEALELLREPALERTLDDFELLVPVLRWLAGSSGDRSAGNTPGRDPGHWRSYLAEARWRPAE
jgi:hypothetical protein